MAVYLQPNEKRAYQVFQTFKELNEDMAGIFFGKFLFANNQIEELAFRCKLENEIDAVSFVEGVL